MSHYREVCQYGWIHAQCRCPGPKTAVSVSCTDPEHAAAALQVPTVDSAAFTLPPNDPDKGRPGWCICEKPWYQRGLLDPHCRHDDITDLLAECRTPIVLSSGADALCTYRYGHQGHHGLQPTKQRR
jgi:hypothetical protein